MRLAMHSSSLALLAAALAATGCGGGGGSDRATPNPDGARLTAGVAAKVGHTAIRESAVRAKMDANYKSLGGTAQSFGPPDYASCMTAKRRAGRRPGETAKDLRRQCKFEFGITRAQAVDTLVRELWLTREARRQGIDTREEVRQALRRAAKLAALTHHKVVGQEGLKAVVRMAALQDKLMAAIPLTEREIADYGNANGDVFLDSETRRASILQTTTKAKAQRARAQLDRGVAWPEIQNRYGIRPFRAHWSGTKTIRKSLAPGDAFGRALFTTKRGKIVGPINTLNGWFVFEVKTIRPPRHTRLTTEAHNTVATTLRSKRLDQILHSHYDSQTTCASQYQIPEAPQCERNPAPN